MNSASKITLASIVFLSSCSHREPNTQIRVQPKYLVINNGSDTINYTDSYNLRQGHWIYFEQMPANGTSVNLCRQAQEIANDSSLTQFADQNIAKRLEEGYYLNDKKTGYWKSYRDGKVTDSVEYKNDMMVKRGDK